jgi:hypothetical protein
VVRAALYIAVLVASRRNSVIQDFYRRLRKAGKAPEGGSSCLHAQIADDS